MTDIATTTACDRFWNNQSNSPAVDCLIASAMLCSLPSRREESARPYIYTKVAQSAIKSELTSAGMLIVYTLTKVPLSLRRVPFVLVLYACRYVCRYVCMYVYESIYHLKCKSSSSHTHAYPGVVRSTALVTDNGELIRTNSGHICGDAVGRSFSAAVSGPRTGASIPCGGKHSCQHRPVFLQLDCPQNNSLLEVRMT